MGDFFTDAADAVGAVVPGVGAVVNAIQTGDNNRESRDLAVSQNAINRDFAREQSQFNSREAAVQREYQTSMSNTAHQREMEDLRRAGLNPILSVNGGASTPSGASGSAVGASAGSMPSTSPHRLGDALSQTANSAIAQQTFRKQMQQADASIAVDNATTASKITEADKNQASAKGQRLTNQVLATQMPAVAAAAKTETGQSGWDAWYQGFDNFLRRAGNVGTTLMDTLNPVSAVRRSLDYKYQRPNQPGYPGQPGSPQRHSYLDRNKK